MAIDRLDFINGPRPSCARDVARALAKTNTYAQSRHDRKKVDLLFAPLKRILRLARLRLRGPSGAQFEFTLAAIAVPHRPAVSPAPGVLQTARLRPSLSPANQRSHGITAGAASGGTGLCCQTQRKIHRLSGPPRFPPASSIWPLCAPVALGRRHSLTSSNPGRPTRRSSC
jgi:hypothetical protein